MSDTKHYARGLYRVEIDGQEFGKTPNTNSPYFRVFFKPLELVDTTDSNKVTPAEDIGRRDAQIWLTEKALAQSKRRLHALGMSGSFAKYDSTKEGHTSLSGKKVLAWCKGVKEGGFEEWAIYVPGSEKRGRNADPKVAESLDNLFGGIGAAPTDEAAPESSAPAGDIPEPGDEDMEQFPFD